MGLRAPGQNLSCPLCTRASYIWGERDSGPVSASILNIILKGNRKAYCPSCGISFRVSPFQLILSYFKKAPLSPILYQNRINKEPEFQVSMINSRSNSEIQTRYIEQSNEEPSGIHLKIASKTIGLKIEMSVTGGNIHDKVIPLLSKAVEETSEACASIYQLCKVQFKAWAAPKEVLESDEKSESSRSKEKSFD